MNEEQGMEPFKLLMVVGSANDIFVYNMAKWLKKSMDIQIDIYEFYPDNNQCFGYEYYDSVESAPNCNIKYLRIFINPILKGRALDNFLKDKHYDAIHLHWMTSSTVMAKTYKQHCQKLYATFWGREYNTMRLFGFNSIYRIKLAALLSTVDYIVDYPVVINQLRSILPSLKFKGDYINGVLASEPLECLYQLSESETKEESKVKLSFPEGKISVLLGYSGKRLHQHIDIVKELAQRDDLKEKIHLFAPMTRGVDSAYVEMLEEELKNSGYSYTVIKGHFLSDEEVARIRNATDVALQLSTTDSWSRSIVECICARAILVYGSWLDYSGFLSSEHFQAIKVESIKDGIDKLEDIVRNIHRYDEMVQSNYENGKKHNLWSICIKDWVEAYKLAR